MIFSKNLNSYVPVNVKQVSYEIPEMGNFTKYWINHGKIPVGYVDLIDTPWGVEVKFLKNMQPELYRGLGKIADQIEVEHCLNRDMNDFEVISQAALNSHAVHYLRGKRFKPDTINVLVKDVIDKTPKGQEYNTRFLGSVSMYMPKELIQHYVELSKTHPIIRKP